MQKIPGQGELIYTSSPLDEIILSPNVSVHIFVLIQPDCKWTFLQCPQTSPKLAYSKQKA